MRLRAALAAVVVCVSAAASPADERCAVPSSLLDPGETLARTAVAVRLNQRLDVLILSSAPMQTGAAKGLRSYPLYFEATLRARLRGADVRVAVRAAARRSTAEWLPHLADVLAETKPALVIWQSGTSDAFRGVDQESFGRALEEGVSVMRKAGTDVVLMGMQYSPRTNLLMDSATYIQSMRRVAETTHASYFDRFEIMRYWNETGAFDLTSLRNDGLFEKVHLCIGRLLAEFVVRGAALGED